MGGKIIFMPSNIPHPFGVYLFFVGIW